MSRDQDGREHKRARVAADSLISQPAAIAYWDSVSADTAGMLGGYPQISAIDLRGSANFVAKLRRSRFLLPASVPALAGVTRTGSRPDETQLLRRAVDCGAGIGRITRGLLAKLAEEVDIVEPVTKFTAEITAGSAFEQLRAQRKIGAVYNVGLEGWLAPGGVADDTDAPDSNRMYELIWNQWVLPQLTDAQLVMHLARCARRLTPAGVVVVKENINTAADADVLDAFDETDNSVTRGEAKYRAIFLSAGYRIVMEETQRGFPAELFPVKMWALRPHADT